MAPIDQRYYYEDLDRDLLEEAQESRARELEAAIQRFRDCGVDLDRMEIQERDGRH